MVFVVVISSLLLPGTTLGWLAQRLGLVEES
jgi:NhaP-type Na+/H+ and K+/H+ antiporter